MTSGRGLLTGWFCMSLSTWVSVIRWQTFVADHLPMQLVNRDGGGSSAGGAHVAWDGLYFLTRVSICFNLTSTSSAYLLASSDASSN